MVNVQKQVLFIISIETVKGFYEETGGLGEFPVPESNFFAASALS
jgi:hypothetical protein